MMTDDTKERARSDVSIAFSDLKNQLVIRWYRIRWLRFAGAAMVGFYGALTIAFLVLGALSTFVQPVYGSGWTWWFAGGCAVVTLIGWFISTSE